MYAVRGALVRVFVPEYHVRGVVHLADRDGVALLPPTSRVRRTPPATHTARSPRHGAFFSMCPQFVPLRACFLTWCAA